MARRTWCSCDQRVAVVEGVIETHYLPIEQDEPLAICDRSGTRPSGFDVPLQARDVLPTALLEAFIEATRAALVFYPPMTLIEVIGEEQQLLVASEHGPDVASPSLSINPAV